MARSVVDTAGGLTGRRIESLLSARLHVEPQLAGDTLVFVSNLSGHLSLYAMDVAGGMPQPLLPPQIASRTRSSSVGTCSRSSRLERIVVLVDRDGDENYEPRVVPLAGGFPSRLRPRRSPASAHLIDVDLAENVAYFQPSPRGVAAAVDPRRPRAARRRCSRAVRRLSGRVDPRPHARRARDSYTIGDSILYELDGDGARRAPRDADRGARGRARVPARRAPRGARHRERAGCRPRHEPLGRGARPGYLDLSGR